jgi:hypothetical protein
MDPQRRDSVEHDIVLKLLAYCDVNRQSQRGDVQAARDLMREAIGCIQYLRGRTEMSESFAEDFVEAVRANDEGVFAS